MHNTHENREGGERHRDRLVVVTSEDSDVAIRASKGSNGKKEGEKCKKRWGKA